MNPADELAFWQEEEERGREIRRLSRREHWWNLGWVAILSYGLGLNFSEDTPWWQVGAIFAGTMFCIWRSLRLSSKQVKLHTEGIIRMNELNHARIRAILRDESEEEIR